EVLGDLRGGGERVHRQACLDQQAQPLGHAGLPGDQRADLLGAGGEALGDAGAELRPLLGAGGRPAVERGAGGGGGGVDVGGGACGDAADHRSVGRVVDVDVLLAL